MLCTVASSFSTWMSTSAGCADYGLAAVPSGHSRSRRAGHLRQGWLTSESRWTVAMVQSGHQMRSYSACSTEVNSDSTSTLCASVPGLRIVTRREAWSSIRQRRPQPRLWLLCVTLTCESLETRRSKIFDETPFQRPSLPSEYVEIISYYANRKPTCDKIYCSSNNICPICHHLRDMNSPNLHDIDLDL